MLQTHARANEKVVALGRWLAVEIYIMRSTFT